MKPEFNKDPNLDTREYMFPTLPIMTDKSTWPLENEGFKADAGKVQMELVPTDVVEEIAKVLTFGAKKYSPRNWEKGMAWSRPYGALLRHMFQWWAGEDKDPETGLSHLAHAGCCLFFLLGYELRGTGTDDRYKIA